MAQAKAPGCGGPGQTTTTASTARVKHLGCPCGCRTRLPWIDDPDCVRHRPVPRQFEDAGHYDVLALGLAPHPRETCEACRQVGR